MTDPTIDRQLGEVAVFNEILTEQELAECLAIQADLAGHDFPTFLGKILIQKFYMDRITLAALLRALGRQRGQKIDVDSTVNLIKLTPTEHKVLIERIRERGILTPEVIDACYDIQVVLQGHGIDTQLGEILIEKGHVSHEIIADILAEHGKKVKRIREAAKPAAEKPPEPAPPPEDEDDESFVDDEDDEDDDSETEIDLGEVAEIDLVDEQVLFGQIAVEKRLLAAGALETALAMQRHLKRHGMQQRIGDLLVEKRYLRPPDVRRILALQQERLAPATWGDAFRLQDAEPGEATLGQRLIDEGILSPHEIGECLSIQLSLRENGIEKRLGDILVTKGYVRRDVVERVVGVAEEPETEFSTRVKRAKSAEFTEAYREVLRKLGAEPGR